PIRHAHRARRTRAPAPGSRAPPHEFGRVFGWDISADRRKFRDYRFFIGSPPEKLEENAAPGGSGPGTAMRNRLPFLLSLKIHWGLEILLARGYNESCRARRSAGAGIFSASEIASLRLATLLDCPVVGDRPGYRGASHVSATPKVREA